MFLAGFGADEPHEVALALPGGDLDEESLAGLDLDLEAFLGDEGVAGVSAVMDEALGVPGGFGEGGAVKERGGFVDFGKAGDVAAAGEEGGEGGSRARGGIAGEGAKALVE